jgi:hypothetical protein
MSWANQLANQLALANFDNVLVSLWRARGLNEAQAPASANPKKNGKIENRKYIADVYFSAYSAVTPTLPATRPVSWLLAAGKNPAYDFFPCQHQV